MHNLKLAYSPSTTGAAGNSGKRHSKATEADSSRAERERGNFEAADTLGRKERRPLTSVPSRGVGVGVGVCVGGVGVADTF